MRELWKGSIALKTGAQVKRMLCWKLARFHMLLSSFRLDEPVPVPNRSNWYCLIYMVPSIPTALGNVIHIIILIFYWICVVVPDCKNPSMPVSTLTNVGFHETKSSLFVWKCGRWNSIHLTNITPSIYPYPKLNNTSPSNMIMQWCGYTSANKNMNIGNIMT